MLLVLVALIALVLYLGYWYIHYRATTPFRRKTDGTRVQTTTLWQSLLYRLKTGRGMHEIMLETKLSQEQVFFAFFLIFNSWARCITTF